MYEEYKNAFLAIVSRYNQVYKQDMDHKDLQTVEDLILSGLGFWETDDLKMEFYHFPCFL